MDPLARLLSAEAGEPPGVLVVVAHPDDEVLGCGALLARLSSVRVVHVTDGAPRAAADARDHGFADRETYASRRAAEAEAALALAGHPATCLVRLGIADQEASLHLAAIAGALRPFVNAADVVLTHAYEGGHSDHDAVAFAVAVAWLAGGRAPMLVEMPFYRAELAADGESQAGASGTARERGSEHVAWRRQRFLFHPGAGPERLLALSPAEQALKRRMVAAHATQRKTLEPFSLETERYRVAPQHDFEALPHGGALLYEHHGWNMTGPLWLARVRAAKMELGWRRPR